MSGSGRPAGLIAFLIILGAGLFGGCTGDADAPDPASTTPATPASTTVTSTIQTTAVPTTTAELPDANAAPAPRMGHAMVSVGEGRLLVFGGRSLQGNAVTYLQDTWIYDTAANSWAEVVGAGPAPRSQHAMAFDPIRNQVLVFGGYVGTGFTYGDTWLFDVGNETWRRVEAGEGPSARAGSVATFDLSAGAFVMFAGAEEPPAAELPLAETWVFDPVVEQWGRRFTNQAPSLVSEGHPTLFELAMVYDEAARRSVLMVAGESTWAYNATAVVWTKIDALGTQGLGADYMTAAAYDTTDRLTIAYGGAPTERTAATWAYDEVSDTWEQLAVGVATPGPRANHAMAYDPATQRTYLFGGAAKVLSLESPDPVSDEMWAFDAGGWSLVAP